MAENTCVLSRRCFWGSHQSLKYRRAGEPPAWRASGRRRSRRENKRASYGRSHAEGPATRARPGGGTPGRNGAQGVGMGGAGGRGGWPTRTAASEAHRPRGPGRGAGGAAEGASEDGGAPRLPSAGAAAPRAALKPERAGAGPVMDAGERGGGRAGRRPGAGARRASRLAAPAGGASGLCSAARLSGRLSSLLLQGEVRGKRPSWMDGHGERGRTLSPGILADPRLPALQPPRR